MIQNRFNTTHSTRLRKGRTVVRALTEHEISLQEEWLKHNKPTKCIDIESNIQSIADYD